MRLTIVTIGSRGDVYPYARLAVELRNARYEVRFATHDAFRPLAESLGIEFAPIAGDPQRMLESEEGRSWVEAGSNPVAYVRRLRRLVQPTLEAMSDDVLSACEGSDAIVYYARLGTVAYHVAEKLGVPAIEASTHPLSRTREFAAVGAPELHLGGRLTAAYNMLTHLVSEQANWQPFRDWTNGWRRRTLGLAAAPFLGPDADAARKRRPIVYAYSPVLLPRPRDWGDWLQVTGFWFLDELEWRPPRDLLDFISSGSPPVVVGFGSMTVRDPHALAETVVSALRLAGRRGILLGGWGGIRSADPGEDVFQIDYAPHAWLYSRAAAAVHHGGVGSVGAALRAGTPSVAIPFFADQIFWGERLRRIGAGPPPIRRDRLSAAALASAIRRLTGDPTLTSQAERLGSLVRAERGVERAVAVITQLLPHG